MGRFYLNPLNKLIGNYSFIGSSTLESELVTGALISGQVTVFKSFLSRKSKHSFNLYQSSKLSQGNNSTTCQWRFLHKWSNSESYHRRGRILFSNRGASHWNGRGRLRTGRFVLPSPNGCLSWKFVYSDRMVKLVERLLEDILNHIDCEPWVEMKWPALNWRVAYLVWLCGWTVVWRLYWDPKTVLAIFSIYDMDICNKLSWLIFQIDSR